MKNEKKLSDEATKLLQQTEDLLKISKPQEQAIKEKIEQEEKDGILFKLQSFVKDKNSPEKLKEQDEKRQFIGGYELSNLQIKLLHKPQNHPSQFTKKKGFYLAICMMLGKDPKVANYFRKPKIFADLTNILIYGRFNKEVLPYIQNHLNSYTSYCKRDYFHYQFLDAKDLPLLEQIIDEAVVIINDKKNLHEVGKEYFRLYGISFQLSLFDSNEINRG